MDERIAGLLDRRSFVLGAASLSALLALGVTGCTPATTKTYLSPGPLADYPGDTCYLFQPTNPRSPSPTVFYFHGAGETATTALSNSAPLVTFLKSMAGLGYTVLVADFGDPTTDSDTSGIHTFGNHFEASRVEAYRQWLLTSPSVAPNVDASATGLLGASMGACGALGYARDYPEFVKVAGTVAPFTDIAWTRSDRDDPLWPSNAFLASLCDIAWDLLETDATPPDADFNNLESLVGLPWRGYYRTDDGLINPERLAILQHHMGPSSAIFDVGTTGGHYATIWGDVPFNDFTSWFQVYLPVPPATTSTSTSTSTTESTTSAPETTTTTPDTTTTIPDTTIPDTTIPDTTIPDTTIPDTTIPDTTIPDTTTSIP